MLITALKNRKDAGQSLASRLLEYAGRKDVVVLGLPRGGVPVAFEISKILRVPMDVFLAGKLGFPGQPELAMGAVTSQGIKVFNNDLLEQSNYSDEELERLIHGKILELERKEALYRQGGPPVRLENRTVLVVDDGAATGASMRAALQALRKMNPKSIMAAVPVASGEGIQAIEQEADETICLQTPDPFYSVGQWYEDFSQVDDESVIRCLHDAKEWSGTSARKRNRPVTDSWTPVSLAIHSGGVRLGADVDIPSDAVGLVLFAHGSGSGRLSPRNRKVARHLNEAGLGTVLLDLLTREEEDRDWQTGEFRFDIGLLAERLAGATRWAKAQPRLSRLNFGYFGASTGAAAALSAAAMYPNLVKAVVSRGGRPDLAGEALPGVSSPTLFIVGGEDREVLSLNRTAMEAMHCERKVEIVSGASHLFEERGALDEVARLAAAWLRKHLAENQETPTPPS